MNMDALSPKKKMTLILTELKMNLIAVQKHLLEKKLMKMDVLLLKQKPILI